MTQSYWMLMSKIKMEANHSCYPRQPVRTGDKFEQLLLTCCFKKGESNVTPPHTNTYWNQERRRGKLSEAKGERESLPFCCHHRGLVALNLSPSLFLWMPFNLAGKVSPETLVVATVDTIAAIKVIVATAVPLTFLREPGLSDRDKAVP